jgi:hypothetical protein
MRCFNRFHPDSVLSLSCFQRRRLLFVWTTLCALCFTFSAHAYTHFQDSNTQKQRSIAWWPKLAFPLALYVDADPTTVPGKTWFQVVQQAAARWSRLPGSFARLMPLTLLTDIKGSNFAKEVKVGDGRHEIILEQDGAILKSLGLDPSFVAGVGVPIVNASSKVGDKVPIAGKIVDSFVVINGKLAWNAERMERVLLHELGHLLGLAHSNVAHPISAKELPIMFYDPLQTAGDVNLHPDDIAGVASLYPTPDFEKRYGQVQGQIRRANGTPVFGVAVILEPANGGEPIASWSDEEGKYQISGIPPGRYLLHVRPLDASAAVRKLDPAIHLGGVYQKATRNFCPELFDDQPFQFCRIQPKAKASSILEIRAGQTLLGVDVQEGDNSPASNVRCQLGSWPQLKTPGRSLQPPPYPIENKRGHSCPVTRFEPQEQLSDATIIEVVEKTKEQGYRQEGKRLKELKAPGNDGCFCQATPHWTQLWWILFFCLVPLFRPSRKRTHQNHRWWGGMVVLLLWLSPATSDALVVQKPTWTQLQTHATDVVQVRFLHNRAVVSKGGVPLLQTQCQILNVYKGNLRKTVTLQLLGKVGGKYRIALKAIPRFKVGQKAILFLKTSPQQTYPLLVALYFGVFDLKKDKEGRLRVHSRGQLLPAMSLATFEKKLSLSSNKSTTAK